MGIAPKGQKKGGPETARLSFAMKPI